MSHSRIAELDSTKDQWAIQARVCRVWEAMDLKNNNEVFALEMVFVDDQVLKYGEEKLENKTEVNLETEPKSTNQVATPPPEPKSTLVATQSPEKIKPPHGGENGGLQIVVTEKRLALIKAWEENEKTKADNKAYTKKSAIGAWENTKRAAIEAGLKQIEENIEIEKAKEREKMKNKMAAIHREAEEKRAAVEAKRGQDLIKLEEAAEKFRATGTLPSKLFKCFGY